MPKCKICAHCLAMIMTNVQLPGNGSSDELASKRKTIKLQPMQDRSKPLAYVVEQETYGGPKKPPISLEHAVNKVLPLSHLATQVITARRALDNDFAFFQDVLVETKCPEYNEYNTRLCREAGMNTKPKTEVAFLPLVNLPLLTPTPSKLR